ncbi:formimidoylglutamase [Oceanospirillum linum]|uniref:Formimidoylglutamase n=1 Tax=Oceanospirillum linum TaxID=966 RepID=A0A1T1HDS0_OCELI|nr:formimidoylglutamase [Oceanospirillum linum]OOV88008.1 formimidoylglutamase [Oceanospirillum linum]SEF40247.1 formiminoglutamase [Oleiphilus messinensis]SMP00440.1 formiminoglutamase [Oceanospirillum linum]
MKKQPSLNDWQGRNDQDDPAHAQRWHNRVVTDTGSEDAMGILGFSCDIGVRRNHGRPGAAEGPAALRKQLANLPWHAGDGAADQGQCTRLLDLGDVVAEGDDLESAQAELADSICQGLKQVKRLLVIGGGHETAYGSFCGLYKALGAKAKIGIINLDAHFDLRKPESAGPSSGTPFYQIRELTGSDNFHYCCLGVAQESNTDTLFNRAQQWGVQFRTDKQMTTADLPEIALQLEEFSRPMDALYLTIDIDVLPHYQAPGVSAPAARGVNLEVIEAVTELVILNARRCKFGLPLADLTELNPSCDSQGVTARTAAFIANALLSDT